MKKIGIDLDTTLNNLDEVWLNRYNKDYNDNLKEFKTWDVEKCVKKECGNKIFNYLKEPGFFYDLDINSGAKETLDFLSKHYELYIVTAYSPDVCVDKVNWIKKNKLPIKTRNIIFINNKGLLDMDYLIDDGPHNIIDFTNGTGLIFDMPYNRSLDKTKYPNRFGNWKEIREFFEEKIKIKENFDRLTKNNS